jgi:hypothetical protein
MYESPDYQVIKKVDECELRLYHQFHTVSIQESSLSGYSGFGYLFNYISGNNKASTKMKSSILSRKYSHLFSETRSTHFLKIC